MNTRIIPKIFSILLVAANVIPGGTETASNELSVKSIQILADPGGRVDWSHHLNRIAYDAPHKNGYYDIFTIKQNGAKKTCVTCDQKGLPGFHIGNPEWHPSGDYLAFQAVDPSVYRRLPHDEETKKNLTEPGVGVANNIWIANLITNQFFQMTDVAAGSGLRGGVLHPHFSPDGTLLAWSERIGRNPFDATGEWVIRLADFRIIAGRPQLQNIRTFQPGKDVTKRLFETHGFSPDGVSLLYTANSDGQTKYGFDIYRFFWNEEKLIRLTRSRNTWDEHAHFTPGGDRIVWMSSEGYQWEKGLLKTELWSMKPDGSGEQRLTSFNIPGSPHYQPDPYGVVAADFAWARNGKQMALYVIPNSGRSTLGMPGRVLLVKFQ